MATRDYVRQANGNKSPKRKPSGNKRSGSKGKTPPRRFPWLVCLVTLILVITFGFGLYQLTHQGKSSPSKSAKVAPPAAKLNPTKAEKKHELPKPPVERWSVAEELEHKKVDVIVPPEPTPPHPYQMQCGSFRLTKQAEELKAKIAFQGLSSQVLKSQSKGNKPWYRVVLGPYPQRRQAQNDQHKLERANINGCRIWYWQG